MDTFEDYYLRDTRSIIGGAYQQLLSDPKKRFMWAETSFFQRWYEVQDSNTKARFKELVNNGQWEFVGGGWVQNDEANPDPFAVINQVTSGHEYLLKNFGVQPRIAWQIDPFGHSAATASLFALMGYDALVINRIHFNLKNDFKNQKHMEFIWKGSDVGGDSATHMFTHVLHTHYSAPKTFDWEEPGNIPVNSMNIDSRARELVEQIKTRMQSYRTRHHLVTWGDDFKFKNAQLQFQQMDMLINHINTRADSFGLTISYSTPGEYFRAVQQEGATFPVFTGDFFPYADNGDSYWTGYYTTRPFMKIASRRFILVTPSNFVCCCCCCCCCCCGGRGGNPN